MINSRYLYFSFFLDRLLFLFLLDWSSLSRSINFRLFWLSLINFWSLTGLYFLSFDRFRFLLNFFSGLYLFFW